MKYLMFILLIASISCASKKETSKTLPVSQTEMVSGTWINGNLVSIANIEESNLSGACSEHPCIAQIKILDIIKKDGLTPSWLSINDTITAYFKFTLSPTPEKYFPNIDKKYLGLKINDTFNAKIEYQISTEKDEITWIVYEYYHLNY